MAIGEDKRKLLESLKRNRFSDKIVDAFSRVNREYFVPMGDRNLSYQDVALAIGYGQTISQPYTIAFMLNLLELQDNQKILEIGSGSGYVLALLSKLSKSSEIYGVERIKGLVNLSKNNLWNYSDVRILHKNGSKGLKFYGKFDRILVSAAYSEMPEHLLEQLTDEGVLVTPVGNSIIQVKKTSRGMVKREFPGFVFVPVIDE